jgi:hypothetical protein
MLMVIVFLFGVFLGMIIAGIAAYKDPTDHGHPKHLP